MDGFEWDWAFVSWLYFFACDYYISGLLERRRNIPCVGMWTWAFLYFVISCYVVWQNNTVGLGKVIIGAGFLILWISMGFCGTVKGKLAAGVSMFFLANLVDCLIFIVFMLVGLDYNRDIYSNSLSRNIFGALHTMTFFISAYGLKHLRRHRSRQGAVAIGLGVCLSLIFIFIFWIYAYRLINIENAQSVKEILWIMTGVAFILFIVCVFALVAGLERIGVDMELKRSILRAYQESMEDISGKCIELDEIREGYKSRVLDMINRYKAGERLNITGDEASTPIYGSDTVLKLMVADKYKLCKERGISLEAVVMPPDNMDIPDTDICQVVFNLMDNAIKASAATDEKYIKLKIYPVGEYLVISTENPVPLTAGKRGSGLGLKIAGKIVRRYKGTDLTTVKDGVYIHIITLHFNTRR